MKKSIFFFSLIFIVHTIHAGGWLQGEDKGFFKVNQSIIKGNQFYDGNGDIIDIVTIGVYQTSFYGEYGFSKKIDGIAYLPFLSRVTLNDALFSDGRFQRGDELTSIGDAQIGIKYGIRQDKPLVISASFLLGIPLGNDAGGETGVLQTGDGELNQLLMLDFGYGFSIGKSSAYANLGVGINNRSKGFSEEFRTTAELGIVSPNEKWIIAAKLSSVQSFMNGEPEGSAGQGVFSNNLEYISFGPEISYLFSKNFGITTSIQGAFQGQFILAEPSYNFGIFWKRAQKAPKRKLKLQEEEPTE